MDGARTTKGTVTRYVDAPPKFDTFNLMLLSYIDVDISSESSPIHSRLLRLPPFGARTVNARLGLSVQHSKFGREWLYWTSCERRPEAEMNMVNCFFTPASLCSGSNEYPLTCRTQWNPSVDNHFRLGSWLYSTSSELKTNLPVNWKFSSKPTHPPRMILPAVFRDFSSTNPLARLVVRERLHRDLAKHYFPSIFGLPHPAGPQTDPSFATCRASNSSSGTSHFKSASFVGSLNVPRALHHPAKQYPRLPLEFSSPPPQHTTLSSPSFSTSNHPHHPPAVFVSAIPAFVSTFWKRGLYFKLSGTLPCLEFLGIIYLPPSSSSIEMGYYFRLAMPSKSYGFPSPVLS